jgi:2-polyprenyl-3-methyl-5-hydroxy-6-metoxy-1,4-benzoquinol methylase
MAPPGYDKKSADYFREARPEMLSFVPTRSRRVLDVGCGGGAFGESLKKTREVEVWGVEPVKSVAAIASAKLDKVVEGIFGGGAGLPVGMFDCVLFNDVLEHMLDPGEALSYARRLLAPGGVVVASIPNIRSFPTFWQLLYHASWEYRNCGVLDETHLRFFTKSSMVNMFEREGYVIERVEGINAFSGFPNVSKRVWLVYRIANVLVAGGINDMKFQQFVVVAKPSERPCPGHKANGG